MRCCSTAWTRAIRKADRPGRSSIRTSIQEVQIGGLGAPAEYGGFTGAIINTVTKSGGNAFSGLFSHSLYERFAGSRQHQQQRPCRKPVAWPGRRSRRSLTDYTVQLGGPLKTGQGVLLRERPALLDETQTRLGPSRTRRTSARGST